MMDPFRKPGNPHRLGDVLGAVMAKYGLAATTARAELERAWLQVAEPELQEHTRVGALRRGVLEILVDNSILLQELEGFGKHELLNRLKETVRHSTLTGLKFRKM
jgi:hypothetical protein